MRVVYSLKSRDFDGVAAEAAWAESMGLRRRVHQRDRARFIPAAGRGRHVHQPGHAGNPRGDRLPALAHGGGLHCPRPAGRQQRPVPPGTGHAGEGTHRAAVLHPLDRIGRFPAARVRSVAASHLGLLGHGQQPGIPGRFLPVLADDAVLRPGPQRVQPS